LFGSQQMQLSGEEGLVGWGQSEFRPLMYPPRHKYIKRRIIKLLMAKEVPQSRVL
jgi:hypothetical protein